MGSSAVRLVVVRGLVAVALALPAAFAVAWNVVVSVTYVNDKGYEGIAEAFEKIRRAHTTVPVDGKGLRDLGMIVESKRMFKHPAHSIR